MSAISEIPRLINAFVGLRTVPAWMKGLVSVLLIAVVLFAGAALWLQPDVFRQPAPFLVDLRLPLKGIVTLVAIAVLALMLAVLWTQPTETEVADTINFCIRRALLSRTQAQQNRVAMFESIDDCRQRVQLTFKNIRNKKLRQHAMNLMLTLDTIRRLKQSELPPEVCTQIDRHKSAAIEILRSMAALVGSSYPLPQNGYLAESVYWNLDQATAPPTAQEIKNSLPVGT